MGGNVNLSDSAIYYCKTAKFQENISEANAFIKLSLLRRISSQLGNLSFLMADNQASCEILHENLKKYSDMVDDKNNVNNYAESIQALVKYFKRAECQKWKSGLDSDLHLYDPPECCINHRAGDESIRVFQEAYKNCDKASCFIKQDCQSVESLNSNEKRKNCFAGGPDEGPIVVKARKLEEHSYGNKFSKVVKDLAVNNPGNRFKTLSAIQEPIGDSRPIGKPGANFRTASSELRAQQLRKFGSNTGNFMANQDEFEPQLKKSLGSRSRPVSSKFVAPVKTNNKTGMSYDCAGGGSDRVGEEECDPRLQHIEPKMIELIRSEIMDTTNPLTWDDIAGLQFAKNTIQEIIVWPMLRPDIFTGLRCPPKGILLFGPPGTGKTLIAKCIASQSKSTFFSISASSLTSKWIGDGEKMVRALFAVARVDQPSVVFIDEIDSLLSKRSDSEHESSRRIKTEFLVQLDGATTGEEERLLIIGATNRPQELDDAARRRLVKRLYIPLPEHQARIEMITRLMSKERNNLTPEQIIELADLTDGYSGADVKILCQEAALGPIRSISFTQIERITSDEVRPVTMEDFKTALTRVRSSVSPDDLQCYIDWDKTYGSGSF